MDSWCEPMPNEMERRINFLATALEQANETIRGKTDELSLMRRVADAISQHTALLSLSAELITANAEGVNCKYAVLYSGSADSNPFHLQAVSNVFTGNEQFPGNIHGTRLVRHIEQNGGPVQVDDITKNAIWSEDWPFPAGL